jgi:hypothetical protein
MRIWGCTGDDALDSTVSLSIGRCLVAEAVSAEGAHVASPTSTEASSGTASSGAVSTIGSAEVVAVALSISAAGESSVTRSDNCLAIISPS